jgi:hypothetical protein
MLTFLHTPEQQIKEGNTYAEARVAECHDAAFGLSLPRSPHCEPVRVLLTSICWEMQRSFSRCVMSWIFLKQADQVKGFDQFWRPSASYCRTPHR